MTLEPIAEVRTCFGGRFGVPRQPGLCPSAWGRLEFRAPFGSGEALRGIDGFSHLWLIFGFHANAGRGWRPTVRPPRLGGNRRIGVFASRSTFRPNGLGLSLVRLEGLEADRAGGCALLLGGIDLMDGTPVYDIKPYLAYAEAVPDAAGGFAATEIPRLEVVVTADARQAFDALPERARRVIREALALDPRPAAGATPPGRIFGADLCGVNVRFSMGEGGCHIHSIEPSTRSRPLP